MIIRKSQLIQWLQTCVTVLNENKAYLTDLDSAIGNVDHGNNIARGFGVVAEQTSQQADKDIGTLFKATSMTLMSKVGGASGMLHGNFSMNAALSANGKEELTADELVELLQDGLAGIVQRGRASYLGERSIGHQDPDATSTQMILQALANSLPR